MLSLHCMYETDLAVSSTGIACISIWGLSPFASDRDCECFFTRGPGCRVEGRVMDVAWMISYRQSVIRS